MDHRVEGSFAGRRPAMAVHGGAWNIPVAEQAAHRVGCERALETGWAVLAAGGSALDAVEAAVVELEADPTFDAGRGAVLNAAGFVELDAGVMDGRALRSGAVAAVRAHAHPVSLARGVLESGWALLVHDEAIEGVLTDRDLRPCDPESLVVERERSRWEMLQAATRKDDSFFGEPRGTVGAVACDREGNVAAATSTGGVPFKPVGRVGDSPIAGAGFYADNSLGAVSATGDGEVLIPLSWSYRATALLDGGGLPAEACEEALRALAARSGLGGLIMVDPTGRIGVGFNTPAMGFAYRSPATEQVFTC